MKIYPNRHFSTQKAIRITLPIAEEILTLSKTVGISSKLWHIANDAKTILQAIYKVNDEDVTMKELMDEMDSLELLLDQVQVNMDLVQRRMDSLC